jgi:DNA polymerase-3 subunit beta
MNTQISTNISQIVKKSIAPKPQLASNVMTVFAKLKQIKQNNVVIEALNYIHLNNGRVHLTNIESGAYAILPCIIGEALVDFKTLYNIVSKINKKSSISIQADNSSVMVVVDNNVEHILPNNVADLGNFPDMYNSVVSDTTPLFNSLVDYNIFTPFMSKDELRPSMCGVAFQSENGIVKAIATDSHTLRLEEVSETTEEFSFIAPRDINKINGECTFFHNEKYISVVNDAIGYYFRKIDGVFPEYKNVIPKYDDSFKVDVSAVELNNLIERAKQTANQTTKAVTIRFDKNGTYKVYASDRDFGTQSLIEGRCYFEGVEQSFDMNINADAMQNCLKGLYGGVHLEFSNNVRAILINDNMLSMPIGKTENDITEAIEHFGTIKRLSISDIMKKLN